MTTPEPRPPGIPPAGAPVVPAAEPAMTAPDGPNVHDLAVQDAAAAICPADHRRNADPKQPPCGECYATAESAVAAYIDAVAARNRGPRQGQQQGQQQCPRGGVVTVKTVATLDGPLLEDAWTLYRTAFAELAKHAVQRHMATATEFAQVMGDDRWYKYLALDDAGRLVGLSTFTNHITVEVTPLLSPEYFAHHFPDRWAGGRVWYIGFVAAHPSVWGGTVFAALIEAMWRTIDGTGSVAVYDMCRVNTTGRRLPDKVTALLQRLDPGVEVVRTDEQTYIFNVFPDPPEVVA
jgi:hypothetical protein